MQQLQTLHEQDILQEIFRLINQSLCLWGFLCFRHSERRGNKITLYCRRGGGGGGVDKLKVLLTVKLSCLMKNVDEKPILCMVVEKYMGERSPNVLKGFVFLGLVETKIKTKK